jgi:hypothetical protein
MLSQKFIGTVGASFRHSRARGNPGFSLDFLDSALTCTCTLGRNDIGIVSTNSRDKFLIA